MTHRVPPTRWIAMGIAAALAMVVVIVVVSVPEGEGPEPFGRAAPAADAAVEILLRVETVDAGRGLIRARLTVRPGPSFPADGAIVLTDIGELPVVRVRPDGVPVGNGVDLDVRTGDVSEYPFDRYVADLRASVVAGADRTLDVAGDEPTLPFSVLGSDNAPGFSIDGDTGDVDAVGSITLEATRTVDTTLWALAMMGINWLLAAGAVAVVLSVVLRQRAWESRHLAWLASMLFALAAFRNTAPGAPPIGTFLDFYAFFPAVALIVLSLLALVTTYLTRSRHELGL